MTKSACTLAAIYLAWGHPGESLACPRSGIITQDGGR